MRLKREFVIFLIIFGLLYISGLLSQVKEGFGNPFEEIFRKIKEMQDQSGSYNRWIGYIYKNSSNNGEILNDFKSRVFQPSCQFRGDWATRLPNGMSIPTPSSSADMAMMDYKKYLEALSKGQGNTARQLYDARDRFMAPDCNFLNDPNQYNKAFNVPFK
jgi:hypothetical protein